MADEDVDWSNLKMGEYANYFLVEADFFAFYLDTGQMGNKDQRTKVYNRLIITPIGARRLLRTLQDALAEYKKRFGELRNEHGFIVEEASEENSK
jgi:hypothetical protein